METRILDDFKIAAEALRNGDLVAIPTETVYGLAGNALSEKALAAIFSTKERPTFDPLILHVSTHLKNISDLDAAGLVDQKSLSASALAVANTLITTFWPGPLTLVLPKKSTVPDLATSGLNTVALRQPRHPIAQSLLAALDFPLAAPSANRFGRISPTSVGDVVKELGGRIPFVLSGGDCTLGIESTVVLVQPDTGDCVVLRPGALANEALALVSEVRLVANVSQELQAPGMLKSHYAPRKPLYLFSEGDTCTHRLRRKTAVLRFADLSARGDDQEAARNFFAKLRALDESDAEILLADTTFSKEGLRYAIHDRLQRASSGSLSSLLLDSF